MPSRYVVLAGYHCAYILDCYVLTLICSSNSFVLKIDSQRVYKCEVDLHNNANCYEAFTYAGK